MRNYDYWSEDDVQTLINMRKQGYKHREIAEIIGRDVGAVVAKYNRLGLPKELKITFQKRRAQPQIINCLRCQEKFESMDRRTNRLCRDCRTTNIPANDCYIHL